MDPPWQKHKLWRNPITSVESAGGFALFAQALNPARTAGDSDATLELDPHPGRIGGRVSGTVTLPRNVKVNADCALRLSCTSHFESGSHDFSDDGSKVHWVHELRVAPRTTPDGVEVEFAFDKVPGNLPESQLPIGGSYVDWQLTLTALTDNADLRHTFSVPVFVADLYEDRPQRSASETEALLSEWRSRDTWQPYRAEFTTEGDSLLVRLGPWRGGGLLQIGGWRGLVAILLLLPLSVVLLLFANDELVSAVVTGVFGTLGLMVTFLAVYLWIRTVEIRVRPGRLSLRKHIFGRTVQTRVVSTEDISEITIHFAQLFVVSRKYGALELIDSIHDLRLLNAFRRLIVAYLAPA